MDYLNSIRNKVNQEEKVQQRLDLKDAIETLNSRQKQLIDMIYYQGLTQKDVASHFNVSNKAINNALKRIYLTLKKKIKK